MTANPSIEPSRRKLPRLIALLAIGLLIIGATAAYRYYRYARPLGSGPSGTIVSREPAANLLGRTSHGPRPPRRKAFAHVSSQGRFAHQLMTGVPAPSSLSCPLMSR